MTPDFDKAETAYTQFMEALGLDLDNPHAKDTPRRVVKKYREDVFKGLYNEPPVVTDFENTDGYDGLVFQGAIDVNSMCAHHHLPFVGKAYVSYIPNPDGKVIGLSKLNRIVDYFSRRPQVQESLTQQIHDFLNTLLKDTKGVAVYIEAEHMCVSLRGIKQNSKMKTCKLSGAFKDDSKAREEFFHCIHRD